jgi:translation initiation factor 3 subunit K
MFNRIGAENDPSYSFRFQFNPQEFDYNIVISILFKALTAAPFPDFNLCLSLLGEAPVSILSSTTPNIAEEATDEEKATAQKEASDAANAPSAGSLTDPMIVKLATLSSLLLAARFKQFWKTWESSEYSDAQEFAKSVHGFEDAVRRVALDTVKGAFRTIAKTRLAEYLSISGGCAPVSLESMWAGELSVTSLHSFRVACLH